MSWDWTVLLVVDAAALTLAALVILALFLRDFALHRGASAGREQGDALPRDSR